MVRVTPAGVHASGAGAADAAGAGVELRDGGAALVRDGVSAAAAVGGAFGGAGVRRGSATAEGWGASEPVSRRHSLRTDTGRSPPAGPADDRRWVLECARSWHGSGTRRTSQLLRETPGNSDACTAPRSRDPRLHESGRH